MDQNPGQPAGPLTPDQPAFGHGLEAAATGAAPRPVAADSSTAHPPDYTNQAANRPVVPVRPPVTPSQPWPVPPRAKTHRLLTALMLVLALGLGFGLGNLASGIGLIDFAEMLGVDGLAEPYSGRGRWGNDPTRQVDVDEFARRIDEVGGILDRNALHVYTEAELDQATELAIEGLLLASGDIRAEYFTAEEYELYLRESSGEFVGIGVTLSNLDGKVTVNDVFADSPALEAGVQPGDVVLAVDGEYRDWTVDEVVLAVRRPEGEQVEVVWERDGQEITTVMNVRAIKREIVRSQLIEVDGAKVGYVYLDQFTFDCADLVREATTELIEGGADYLVLDLRNNPGGLLYEAIGIASLYIEDGAIVRIEERERSQTEQRSGTYLTDLPLVVLVNGGSASASELVTAALQDHDRAVVVGEQSYGKGTVQDITQLSFGGAVKYTIANYLSPDGRVIDGVGVTPDYSVDDGDRLNDVDLIHLMETGEEVDLAAEGIDLDEYMSRPRPPLPGSVGYTYQPGDDVQLDKALEILLG